MGKTEKIGEYTVTIPDEPERHLIIGYDLPKKDQKFQRTQLYVDEKRGMQWEDLIAEEELKQAPFLDNKGNPSYEGGTPNPAFVSPDWVNPDCEAFRAQEWNRRINGYWFMNNGVPTYITGLHYFYLNYWKIDVGYPDYRAVDRRRALIWDKAVNDPDSFGVAEITRRRLGKSWWGACIIFEDASRYPNHHSGIQSKEKLAAQMLFSEKIMNPWKDMIDFFRPLSSTGTDSKDTLEFKAEKRKGKFAKGAQVAELRSRITHGPSTSTYYDGQKLHRWLGDEEGKTTECNIVERHYIVRQCCRQGSQIIGKMYEPTTVEEMTKGGGSNYKILWDDSDPKKNKTGLYRLFVPAYEGYIIDEYGNDLIEQSKKHIIEKEFDPYKDDPRLLAAQRRKFPFTVDDAFGGDTSKCIFDPIKLLNRQAYLNNLKKPLYTTINFKWKNNERDTEVVPVSSSSGRIKITFHPDEPNKVLRDHNGKPVRPMNKTNYVIGNDPIEYEFVEGNEMSNAASYCLRKYDIAIDGHERDIKRWKTNRFVMEYVCRPTPKVFYEDMLMACVYFGCEIHVERQKMTGLRNHFIERGYKHFLMDRPESTRVKISQKDKTEGTPASPMMLNAMADAIDSYISEDIYGDDSIGDGYEHGYLPLVDFPRLIKSWMEFDINNTQKSDETIASGFTLLGANKFIKPKSTHTPKIGRFFVSYSQLGDRSVAIDDYEDDAVDDDGIEDPKPPISEERMVEIRRSPYLMREYGFVRD